MSSDSKYYNPHSLLSRNAQFNFIVGMRGNGKTFAFKNWAIRDFLKTGGEFIYLRRYDTELVDRGKFFEDVAFLYPDYEFKVEGYKAYLRLASDLEKNPHDWRLCGYFVKLANAVTKKSTPFPKVNKLGFDEFILDKGYVHYLPNEVKAFQDFYNTVDRWNDRVRVLFMANSVSIMNPYFIGYNIAPKKGSEFTMLKKGFICVQYIKSDAFRDEVKQTRFGRMIADTPYYAYAVDNVFRDDNNLFIKKKTSAAKFYYSIRFDNQVVGIWVDYDEGNYYVSRKVPPNNPMEFVLSKRDMQPNLVMIEKSSGMLASLKRLYMQGSVYFDAAQTREFMNDVLNFLNLR